MSTRPTIAIVGGGVAGALTAVHLARAASAPRVVLIERGPSLARGVAYATASRTHLLNVPAARMSAFADDPEHCLRWARARIGAATTPDAFLPRRLYGEYVADQLRSACAGRRRRIECRRGTVVDLEAGTPARVHLADGSVVVAERVVLALGHMPPRDLVVGEGAVLQASRRYTPNPWTVNALAAVAPDADVLLVGSGLTMYDVVLALRERGHAATIHALSRHGLTPRPHASRPLDVRSGPAPDAWLDVAPTARALLRAVRAACEQATAAGGDWRGVVDSIRPVTARLWARMSDPERVRFLAHVRPHWDVHRHRAAVEVQREIDRLRIGGTLRLHAGRVRAWREDEMGITAVLGEGALRVGHVVNCTGPETDVRRSNDPLVRALLARGLIVRDAHGLGVETADDGALVGADGRASSWLFTLGTWRRPALWESIAIPELRVQAAELASRLAPDAVRPRRSAAVPPAPSRSPSGARLPVERCESSRVA